MKARCKVDHLRGLTVTIGRDRIKVEADGTAEVPEHLVQELTGHPEWTMLPGEVKAAPPPKPKLAPVPPPEPKVAPKVEEIVAAMSEPDEADSPDTKPPPPAKDAPTMIRPRRRLVKRSEES